MLQYICQLPVESFKENELIVTSGYLSRVLSMTFASYGHGHLIFLCVSGPHPHLVSDGIAYMLTSLWEEVEGAGGGWGGKCVMVLSTLLSSYSYCSRVLCWTRKSNPTSSCNLLHLRLMLLNPGNGIVKMATVAMKINWQKWLDRIFSGKEIRKKIAIKKVIFQDNLYGAFTTVIVTRITNARTFAPVNVIGTTNAGDYAPVNVIGITNVWAFTPIFVIGITNAGAW